MLNIKLDDQKLTQKEKRDLLQILAMQNPNITDDLEQIWYLMDKIWDDMGCDNKKLDWGKIDRYYSHPIWLLNGIFIENHEISMRMREKIAQYVAEKNFKNVCDYGGGFGTLARCIAQKCPKTTIYIYEPHPSRYGIEYTKDYNNIIFIDTIQENFYDCVISTDVLEHIENPMNGFQKIISATKSNPKGDGGNIIIANCFYPCIKCHLPQNFHLRYTFNYFAKKMGVKKIENIMGTHATVYKKINDNPLLPRTWELLISSIIFYPIELTRDIIKLIKR